MKQQLSSTNTADLTPHPNNARIHTPEQIAELRKSIRRFGIVRPVICDEDLVVLAGHGLLSAAIAEDIEKVPTLTVSGLSDQQKRAYLLADNRLGERSSWDWNKLALELKQISVELSLADIGFGEWDTGAMPKDANGKGDPNDTQEKKCPRCGHAFTVDPGENTQAEA